MDKRELNRIINEELALRRQRAELEALSYREEAMKSAEYAEINRRLREKELEIMRAEFSKQKASRLKSEMTDLLDQKKRTELRLGIDPCKLSPVYACAKCKDTGVFNGARCECASKIAGGILFKDCSFLRSEYCFESSTENNAHNLKVIGVCKRFADAYPDTDVKNLVITGAVATGKTYLAGCIYNRLAEREIPALGLTAFELSREFLKEHLSSTAEKTGLFRLTDAPLLIIDDLGSEPFYKNVSCEYLFTLIDARGLKRRGTVITTNLNLLQIKERYGERVFSRLQDKRSGICVALSGADKRLEARGGGA